MGLPKINSGFSINVDLLGIDDFNVYENRVSLYPLHCMGQNIILQTMDTKQVKSLAILSIGSHFGITNHWGKLESCRTWTTAYC